MAPEILKGSEFSFSADVYSFSVCLWQCLTRKRPWSNIKDIHKLKAEVCVKDKRLPIPEDVSPEIVALVEDCWNATPTKRPDFREVVARLEDIQVGLVVKDPIGCKFWKKYFLGKEFVPFKQFFSKLDHFLSDSELLGSTSSECDLKLSLDDDPIVLRRENCTRAIFGVDSSNMINIETFGKVLEYVGPLSSDFLVRLVSLMSRAWFHGTVDTGQAEESLKDRKPGTFLIRYSNRVPGQFTITRLDHEGNPVHKRIERENGLFVVSGKRYETLDVLVEKEWKNLNMISSAPGSPYQVIFETTKKKFNYYESEGHSSLIEDDADTQN